MRVPAILITMIALALSVLAPAAPFASPITEAATVPVAPSAAPVGKGLEAPQQMALALFYPWYDPGTWEAGVTASLPAEHYLSGDPATIQRQIAEARRAGLNGLVSAYFGPAHDNPTESNLRTLLDEGARQGVGISVLFEPNSPDFFPTPASQKEALWQVLNVHANHPGYLRIDGKPAIFVFRPRGIVDGAWRIDRDGPAAVAAWQALIDELDPERRALWIAEGEYYPYLEVFDGLFPYSIAWSGNPAGQLQRYASGVRQYPGKYWFAAAMPGYDDTRSGYSSTFSVDRRNGGYYEQTLAAALGTDPDGLMVVSFNEWVEGHAIETGAEWGSLYLDITRSYVDAWRGGR